MDTVTTAEYVEAQVRNNRLSNLEALGIEPDEWLAMIANGYSAKDIITTLTGEWIEFE